MEIVPTQYGMDSTCKAHEYVELPKLLNDAIVYLENKIDDYQIDMIDEDEKTIPDYCGKPYL